MIVPRHFCMLMVLFTLTWTAAFAAEAAKLNSVLDMPEFVRDWRISRQFTLDVADAMPADLYV